MNEAGVIHANIKCTVKDVGKCRQCLMQFLLYHQHFEYISTE